MAFASKCATGIAGIALLCLTGAASANAALRQPQVVVHGSDLRSLFDSLQESIDVQADQQDAELLRESPFSLPTVTLAIQVELVQTSGVVSGIYAGHESAPSLIRLFSDSAVAGWFAVVSFRDNPTRVVVNLFDSNSQFLGTRTTLGGDRLGIGMYVSGPNGTFYSQDERNPGGRPQVLYFAGTGIHSGFFWLTAEDQSLTAGADADFDDVVWFVEAGFEGPYVTPVQRTCWGALKERFR